MNLTQLIVAWLVMSLSLFIISKIPILGVEIDRFETALTSAAVFGILNAFVRPILAFFTFPITVITFGLFIFVLNAIIFALAAAFVSGFRLRNGIWSAVFGAIAQALVYSFLRGLFS